MSNRNQITENEEKAVLQYIIRNNAYKDIRGHSMWCKLAQDKVTKHPAETIRNHFKFHLRHNLNDPRYGLTKKEQKNFQEVLPEKSSAKCKCIQSEEITGTHSYASVGISLVSVQITSTHSGHQQRKPRKVKSVGIGKSPSKARPVAASKSSSSKIKGKKSKSNMRKSPSKATSMRKTPSSAMSKAASQRSVAKKRSGRTRSTPSAAKSVQSSSKTASATQSTKSIGGMYPKIIRCFFEKLIEENVPKIFFG